jgi:hypothetical protein
VRETKPRLCKQLGFYFLDAHRWIEYFLVTACQWGKADEKKSCFMSLRDIVHDTGWVDALNGGSQLLPSSRLHFHYAPNRKTAAVIIKELCLQEGSRITLITGDSYVIRSIRDDEVFVFGLRKPVNVYAITHV